MVFGVGSKRTGVSRGRVQLAFRSWRGGSAITVDALVLSQLTIYAGGLSSSLLTWSHLQGLELADPDFCLADPVDILLGADVYATILGQGLRKGGASDPVAQNTSLG